MKTLLKNILTVCLCWSLFSGQLSLSSFSLLGSSYGQIVRNDDLSAQNEAEQAGATTVETGEIREAGDINAVNGTEHWQDKQANGYGSAVLSALSLFVTGWLAGAMSKCRKIPPSGKVFIVGGIVYLIGEISTTFKLKKLIQNRITVYENSRYIDASQRRALETQLRAYDDQIEVIKQRMGFMLGSFVAFQIAAGLSFVAGARTGASRGAMNGSHSS